MILKLKYPPTVENAPKFAEAMLEPAMQISGVSLDFSVESLSLVDDILEDIRKDNVTSDEMPETLFGFGCYVGEVFVRNANGQWQNTAETSMADLAGFPIVVSLDNHRICNPIGKVFKRLDNGEEDNLRYFYKVFTEERN